jgi:excisionase family DNA binding protein
MPLVTILKSVQTSNGTQRTKRRSVELKTKIAAEEQLLTVDEVRAWLRLGRTRLNDLIQSGELSSLKIGRRRFIRHGDVTEWLGRHRYQPGPER